MPILISLKDVLNEIEASSDEVAAYLNRKTGETFSAFEDDLPAFDDDEEGDDEEGETNLDALPQWQRDAVAKLREIRGDTDGNWVELPSKRDFHEYRVMEEFCQLKKPSLRDDLLDAIQGSGAFGRFKKLIHRHDIADAWYDHRNKALAAFTKEWLDSEGIAYVE